MYKEFFAYCNFLKSRQFTIDNSTSFINLLKNQQFDVIDVFVTIKRFFNAFENEQQSIKIFNFFFLITKSRNFSLFFNIRRRSFFANQINSLFSLSLFRLSISCLVIEINNSIKISIFNTRETSIEKIIYF